MKNILFLLFALGVLSTACSDNNSLNKNGKTIVCTTGMIADVVKNLTDTSFTVVSIMGPGVDPHLYKATAQDLQRLKKADVIFYNGLHLEGKMTEVFENISKTKKVVAVTESISKEKLRFLDESNHVADPHVWFDVALWKEVVVKVAASLIEKYPNQKALIENNKERFLQELTLLHEENSTLIASIPAESRVLITAHDAFGYFGKAYQIDVQGLQGISTVSDYGLNEVTVLVDFIVLKKIKAIFIETSISDKSIKAVLEGCKAKGHDVKIGGVLYSDAMGDEGTPEGTYVGMVKSNVKQIVEALK